MHIYTKTHILRFFIAVVESICTPVTKEILLNFIANHGFRDDSDMMPPPRNVHPQHQHHHQQQHQHQQQNHYNHQHSSQQHQPQQNQDHLFRPPQ